MINRTLFLLLSLFIFASLHVYAQPSQEVDGEAITALLNRYTDDDSPGMAVGVVKDGEVVYEHYLGLANLDHQIRFDENTCTNIASTAKQFTALMILELSMEGKLDLEDDIRKYLPTLYPHIESDIKIRHLINHTSGIRDYVFILEMMDRPYWQQVGMRNSGVIELLEKQEELAFEPGSKYGYSNSGYTILAIIIEEVTGESFNDYSDAFFQKMGMSNTSFLRRYMGVIPNRADSYSDWGDGLWLSTPVVTRFSGDGFLYTTLRDQLHYEQAVQNARSDNNTLLMESQKPIPNSEITDYGFGLQLEGRMGRAAQYHSGSTFGYNSHTTRFPEENLTVFVMSNNMSIWSGNVADRVASLLLPDGGNMEYNSRISQSVRVPDTDQILGQYISPDGFLIRIVEEEGTLTWINESNYPYEIVREEDNLFAVGFNTNIKVGFYDDEVVEFYRDGTTVSYTKSEYVAASQADVAAFVGEYHSQELDVSFEIKMNEDNKLIFALPDWEREIELVNRNELRASDYILKVQRDQFDRPTDILVTLNFRAPNNRFKKVTNLVFQPQIPTDNGSIQVSTVGSVHGDASDILLTANYPNGNEIWFKQFGGNSYDKASSIIDVEDGYLIIGSTSSYGNGNYDMFVIKTDKEGNKIWQNTYGNLYNEYGYIAEAIEHGYLIKGTIQNCTSNSDVFNRDCTTNVWVVSVDENGNEISNEILEEIDRTQ